MYSTKKGKNMFKYTFIIPGFNLSHVARTQEECDTIENSFKESSVMYLSAGEEHYYINPARCSMYVKQIYIEPVAQEIEALDCVIEEVLE